MRESWRGLYKDRPVGETWSPACTTSALWRRVGLCIRCVYDIPSVISDYANAAVLRIFKGCRWQVARCAYLSTVREQQVTTSHPLGWLLSQSKTKEKNNKRWCGRREMELHALLAGGKLVHLQWKQFAVSQEVKYRIRVWCGPDIHMLVNWRQGLKQRSLANVHSSFLHN